MVVIEQSKMDFFSTAGAANLQVLWQPVAVAHSSSTMAALQHENKLLKMQLAAALKTQCTHHPQQQRPNLQPDSKQDSTPKFALSRKQSGCLFSPPTATYHQRIMSNYSPRCNREVIPQVRPQQSLIIPSPRQPSYPRPKDTHDQCSESTWISNKAQSWLAGTDCESRALSRCQSRPGVTSFLRSPERVRQSRSPAFLKKARGDNPAPELGQGHKLGQSLQQDTLNSQAHPPGEELDRIGTCNSKIWTGTVGSVITEVPLQSSSAVSIERVLRGAVGGEQRCDTFIFEMQQKLSTLYGQ